MDSCRKIPTSGKTGQKWGTQLVYYNLNDGLS